MTKRGRPSLARQRHELIVSQIRRTGAARVVDLAEQLDVSEMTVRRDLDALHDAGLVVKVHGGATLRYEHNSDEPGFEAKLARNTDEKRSIAASAALMVTPGAAIGMTAGTTTLQLARELVSIPELTVITNSTRIADAFHADERADRTVILTGGQRTPSEALVGPVAVATISTFNLDMVFMGVHGLHEAAGVTTPNMLEADTNRAFLVATEQLVVIADHSKWGVTGLCSIAPLEAIDVCIVDDELEPQARGLLAERVGRLVIAPPDAALRRTPRRTGGGTSETPGRAARHDTAARKDAIRRDRSA